VREIEPQRACRPAVARTCTFIRSSANKSVTFKELRAAPLVQESNQSRTRELESLSQLLAGGAGQDFGFVLRVPGLNCSTTCFAASGARAKLIGVARSIKYAILIGWCCARAQVGQLD
jgi:hypothetical protein